MSDLIKTLCHSGDEKCGTLTPENVREVPQVYSMHKEFSAALALQKQIPNLINSFIGK